MKRIYNRCYGCKMWEEWCKEMYMSGDWYPEDCIN